MPPRTETIYPCQLTHCTSIPSSTATAACAYEAYKEAEGIALKFSVNRPRTSPGEMLHHEFMQPENLSAEDMAKNSELSLTTVEGILDGTKKVTEEIAEKLGSCLGTTAQFWVNCQKAFDQSELKK
jgi:addiction module HigA family antidote